MAALIGKITELQIPLPQVLLFPVTVLTGFVGGNYQVTGHMFMGIIKFVINCLCVQYAKEISGVLPSGNKDILSCFFYLPPWFTFDIIQSIPFIGGNFAAEGYKIPFFGEKTLKMVGYNGSSFFDPRPEGQGVFNINSVFYFIITGAIFFLYVLSKLPDSIAGPVRVPFTWILGSVAVFTPIFAMLGISTTGGLSGMLASSLGLPSLPSLPSIPSIPSVPSIPSIPNFGIGGGNSSHLPSLDSVVNSLKPSGVEQLGGGAKDVEDNVSSSLFLGILTAVAVAGGGLAFLRSKE